MEAKERAAGAAQKSLESQRKDTTITLKINAL
jgi:hypothetical protein